MTARALLASLSAVFIVSTSLFATPTAVPKEAPAEATAMVLCYHIVESPQDPRMEVSRETFRQHMRYLAMTGYNIIPLRRLYEYVSGKRASLPKNAIVVTIDDGWRSTYTEVFPEMQRRHFPFTVFVYPKIIGQTALAMTWKQVKEMSDAGVDIQSHSLSHPFLTQRRHAGLDEKAYSDWLQNELVTSKKILEKETGRAVDFIAYPYGDYDHRVVTTAARAGYTAALTCDFGRVRRGSDPLRMRRVVVDKKMDFAAFRHYLGTTPMKIDAPTPLPGQVFEPEQQPALVVSAKIPNYRNLDPNSVGMALISNGSMLPYSYDPRDGSISLVVRDAVTALKGKYQRALVWATELKTGRRVEASWTFRLPDLGAPKPADTLIPISTAPGAETDPATAPTSGSQSTAATPGALLPLPVVTPASPSPTPAGGPAGIAMPHAELTRPAEAKSAYGKRLGRSPK
jgi:peptidoglycan/xylan/chitin deacetylase (PgdA/CDA1 family)